eukprot:10873488-Lingulodinium_polyedra.AAC.1
MGQQSAVREPEPGQLQSLAAAAPMAALVRAALYRAPELLAAIASEESVDGCLEGDSHARSAAIDA